MSKSADVAELRALAGRLADLLENPEPGLGTWHAAVGVALDVLADHAPSFTKVTQPHDDVCHHWRGCGQCISQSTGNALREHLERKTREVDRLRDVIRTGGAMYRFERASLGIAGGIDPDDALARTPQLVDETWCDCIQAEKCVRDGCVECCYCHTPRPYVDADGKRLTAEEVTSLQRDVDHAGRVVNHEEAKQLAETREDKSNLARCYLDLARRHARAGELAAAVEVMAELRRDGSGAHVHLVSTEGLDAWRNVKVALAAYRARRELR